MKALVILFLALGLSIGTLSISWVAPEVYASGGGGGASESDDDDDEEKEDDGRPDDSTDLEKKSP